MVKEFESILENKLRHDVGLLIYQYLNTIEPQINDSLIASKLIQFYGLNTGKTVNRCICPIHKGENKTSFVFDDEKRICHCWSCGFGGTYLEFVSRMQNFASNRISEAKIFAANHFAGIRLGFDSIGDFEEKLKVMMIKRFNETGSLNASDYYSISLLPIYKGSSTSQLKEYSFDGTDNAIKKNRFSLMALDFEVEKENRDKKKTLTKGITDYDKAMSIASTSILIKDFTENGALLNSNQVLYDFMMRKYNISQETADKFGLVCFTKDKCKHLTHPDFFMLNDRVLFPYRDDESGIIVGYQSRSINPNIKKEYKYLNLADYKNNLTIENGNIYREFKPFIIGCFLFNLFEIKDRHIDNLWITEGAADTMLLSELGFYSIAAGQSNLTDEQIYLINKHFGNKIRINLFFDCDSNEVGQNNSIRIAYRLYQFGFRNIHIIRTYQELGKDLSDCAVKLKDKEVLKRLVNAWEQDAYRFQAASNDELNELYMSNFYSEAKLMTVDPRKIKEEIAFIKFLNTVINTSHINSEDLKNIMKLKYNPIETLNTFVVKTKEYGGISLEKAKVTSELYEKVKAQDDLSQVNTNKFENLTGRQAYTLMQHFSIEIVNQIDAQCNKKQISLIISNIKRNVEFDINDFLKKSWKRDKTKAEVDDTQNEYHPPRYEFEKDGSFKTIFEEEPPF